jgi:hypothetical protein
MVSRNLTLLIPSKIIRVKNRPPSSLKYIYSFGTHISVTAAIMMYTLLKVKEYSKKEPWRIVISTYK